MTKTPTNKRFFQSLSFRVTFWLSLTVVVIVSIHLYLVRPEQRFFEHKMRDSERLARIIETHLLAEMSTGEPHNIQSHLELLPGLEGIRRVEIVDPELAVRFSTDSLRVGITVDRENDVACKSCHEQEVRPENIVYKLEGVGDVFAVDHVLHNQPECKNCHADKGEILGNILVELVFTDPDLEALSARRRLMTFGGVLLGIMLFGIGTIIHLLVGRPAAELQKKMARIESGDFDVGEGSQSKDEFGVLDRGFHTMVTQLRDLYTNMENMIRQRTNKLYETQAQLMHQEKLAGIGQLAAGVAHEIGNPLTAIDSLTQLLAIESDDPNVREKVKTIQSQIDRISLIVHNMADLSRPLSLDVQSVNVNTVVRSVLSLVHYDTRFRKIKIRSDLDEAIQTVHTVEDRVFGVFLNLVLNAADAMSDGGEMVVSTRYDDGYVVTSFQDTGHGITPANLEKIFNPYFTTKETGKGTGLGLSVCRSFLQSIGGDIDVESKPGEGATFYVRIPSAPDAVERKA